MRPKLGGFLLLTVALQAKPYSGRVKIAEETLMQAKDSGVDYAAKLDLAIDGSASDLREFIRLIRRLDTSGAYFHYFHVYEVATLAGDKKMRAAISDFTQGELSALSADLSEAQGWIKPRKRFAQNLPETTAFLRQSGAVPPR